MTIGLVPCLLLASLHLLDTVACPVALGLQLCGFGLCVLQGHLHLRHLRAKFIGDRFAGSSLCFLVADVFGGLLTATSANRSGAPPARTADDLRALSADPLLLVIDAGPATEGPPSTIVDARYTGPTLVREGAVAWDRVLTSLQG